jgi:heat shock protein HslJ
MLIMRKFILIVIAIIGFSCHKEKSNNVQVSLTKTQWELSYVQNNKTNLIIGYPTYVEQLWGFETMSFINSSDTVSVKGLCNVGLGLYTSSTVNGTIKFNGIFMTQMLCKYYQWEDYLWHNLDSAFQYKINDNKLTIYSKGSYNLIFNQIQN